MSQNQQELAAVQGESQDQLAAELREQDQDRLVPVTEAIRYRKRAQAAERQVEELAEQLRTSELAQGDMEQRVSESNLECELTRHLVKAGATDIEVALLLAKHELKAGDSDKPPEINALVGSLRREKPYLFGDSSEEAAPAVAAPTAGVRARKSAGASNLPRLAQRAAQSGSRKDIQEYLRMRRSVRR